jgi:hypothetical protein
MLVGCEFPHQTKLNKMTVVTGNIVAFTFAVAIVTDATFTATIASKNFRRHDFKKSFFLRNEFFPPLKKLFWQHDQCDNRLRHHHTQIHDEG